MIAPIPDALTVEGLVAGYGPTVVIEGLSLALAPGGRLAVLGRNGVGKTTLINAIAGRARRRAGSVRIGGVEAGAMRGAARAALGLGLVPQGREVFAPLTVEENLVIGLGARPRAELARAYAWFPRLAERRRNLGSQLSGGEQQMLSVARALLGRPRLLLLDEPLEGLAPVVRDELMAFLHALAEEEGGPALLLVEHEVERALDLCDRAVLLERGRIAWEGTAAALRAAPEVVERYVGLGLG